MCQGRSSVPISAEFIQNLGTRWSTRNQRRRFRHGFTSPLRRDHPARGNQTFHRDVSLLAGQRTQHRSRLTVNCDHDPFTGGGPLNLAAQVLPEFPDPDPVHDASVHSGTHAVQRLSGGWCQSYDPLLPGEAFFSDLPPPEDDPEEDDESEEPDEEPESEEPEEEESAPEEPDEPPDSFAAAAACLALFAERVP